MSYDEVEYWASYAQYMYDEKSKELEIAKAEIARLQAEVERWEEIDDHNKGYISVLRGQRETAWNDAIEAAAEVAKGYTKGALSMQAADVIRALKCT